jgi:hypothetical protein
MASMKRSRQSRRGTTESDSISVKLSPAQVDEVVRAASESRSPSILTIISNALASPQNGSSSGKSPLGVHMPMEAVDPRMSRSLLRGLSILTCFRSDGDTRGIVEIAEELSMSPSTTHRYALTLVELGLLERCPESRKYRLREV